MAVCEQLENPAEAKKRGHKAVVKRDVVRLVTPGTLTEETLLEAGSSNYLAALARVKGSEDAAFALAWVDLSTSEFRVTETELSRLETDIARIDPFITCHRLMRSARFHGLRKQQAVPSFPTSRKLRSARSPH